MKLAHITSVHLYGLANLRMHYLDSLSPDVVNVLALCDDRYEKCVSTVPYEPKIYAEGNRTFRGPAYFFGFLDLDIEADYVMMTDYDHLILRSDYADTIMDAMGDAAVMGRGAVCLDGKKSGQIRKVSSEYRDWLMSFSVREEPKIFFCLGTGMVLRRDFIERWRELDYKHLTAEVHIPTVAYHLGYEIKTDLGIYEYVFGGKKIFSFDDVKRIVRHSEAPFLHPFKDVARLGEVYDMIRRYNG